MPSTTRLSAVIVPVLSNAQTLTRPANRMRKGSVQKTACLWSATSEALMAKESSMGGLGGMTEGINHDTIEEQLGLIEHAWEPSNRLIGRGGKREDEQERDEKKGLELSPRAACPEGSRISASGGLAEDGYGSEAKIGGFSENSTNDADSIRGMRNGSRTACDECASRLGLDLAVAVAASKATAPHTRKGSRVGKPSKCDVPMQEDGGNGEGLTAGRGVRQHRAWTASSIPRLDMDDVVRTARCTHYVIHVETCRRHPIVSEHHGDVDVAHRGCSSLVSRMQHRRAVGLQHCGEKRFRLTYAFRSRLDRLPDRDTGQVEEVSRTTRRKADMGINKVQGFGKSTRGSSYLYINLSNLAVHTFPEKTARKNRVARIFAEMPPEPLWRDSKPGPSRLHSPLTASASPFLASPSPSPIDEDDDEQYDPMDDAQDQFKLGLECRLPAVCSSSIKQCAHGQLAILRKLLENTQVSQSVIVLSLHYIFRLKERNDFTLGKPVVNSASLNTYTNKTWSDVSAIPLDELNTMEREFLLGVGFRLFVDKPTYDSWLNLLRGLVLAKEREHMRWRSRRHANLILPCVFASSAQESHHHEHPQQQQRARSTSPRRMRGYAYAPAYPFTFAVPSQSHLSTAGPASATTSQSAQTSPSDAYDGARPHSKRRAADAFSPTSATFAARQAKRPTGLALDIGATLASASSHVSTNGNNGMLGRTSVRPHPYAESLRGFERMSLGSVTPVEPPQHQQQQSEQYQHQHQQPERQEHTLAAPYRGADAARRALPSHLYFYALASSPMRPVSAASTATAAVSEASTAVPGPVEVKIEEADAEAAMGEAFYPPGAERKARLRYSRQAGDGYYGTYGYNGSHPAYGRMDRRRTATQTQAQTHPNGSVPPPALRACALVRIARPPARPPARIGHTQSARTSPLSSFVDIYGTVAGPSIPRRRARASTGCARRTSSTRTTTYIRTTTPAYKPTRQCARADAHIQAVTATSLASALGEPQPVAFANAGAPGVAHFYGTGAGSGSVAGGAGFSGGAMGAPQSSLAGGVPMESQSVGASPSAHVNARGRRL
ncbi:hypothetical protein DFH11DRAFT_1745623 [Phellopilus nigrolimitatus]|nr:hypothetical protein DFH11DRAFT_1745623 [Phellopilus nigrolimitatus]